MWAKLDDQFFYHPKVRAAGKDGRLLYVAGLVWVAGALTDGFIATTDLQLIAAMVEVHPHHSVRLVDVGLWETTPGGWTVHDYHDFNPSADDERRKREARSTAGRKGGLARSTSRNGARTP